MSKVKKYSDSSVAEDEFLDSIAATHRKAAPFENCLVTLVDDAGTNFVKRVDAIPLNPANCTVEFKVSGLNSRKEKVLADKAEAEARHAGYQSEMSIISKLSWSNSAYAHAELTAKLPPLSHITVFKQWPTFEETKLYLKLGILFCHVSGFDLLQKLCRLTREGVPFCTFSFCTPNGQQLNYPLWSMYQHQLANYASRDQETQATNIAWPHKTAPRKVWQSAGFQSAKQKRALLRKDVSGIRNACPA